MGVIQSLCRRKFEHQNEDLQREGRKDKSDDLTRECRQEKPERTVPASEIDLTREGRQDFSEETAPVSEEALTRECRQEKPERTVPASEIDLTREGRQDFSEVTAPVLEEDLMRESLQDITEEITLPSEDDNIYKDLKDDLINYYRANESMIPAAPLVDEHKVALEDLYVMPPMWAYNNPYRFGPDDERQKGQQTSGNEAPKRHRATVSKLFLSKDNVRYRKIYITANAGFGKTSLSQELTMTWCQVHTPLALLTGKYNNADLEAMKYFDFLFLLHLRDYQSEPKCNLDDLIMQMVSENLPGDARYTKQFLQKLLRTKKVLIIADGLDEWAHPDQCRKTPAVPHNNYPASCTVLTTSRPWKLGTIGLSENNIDRHIEISELDDVTRDKLEKNAVRILNEKDLNLAGKDITEFKKEVSSFELGDVIFIPYILLQLICLFFGGLRIGKSKCEIYSSITEFTLERGLNKKNLPDVRSRDNAAVPNFMKKHEACIIYMNLIVKLGKLAFFTLLSKRKESSLTFDRKVALQYMTEKEIEFCLKVGLICQTKDNSIIAIKQYKVFFKHKSVQEFFSAIYITSEWKDETLQSTILDYCSSLSNVLEMSNMFVFVYGMNPDKNIFISEKLQKVVDIDGVTCRYRTDKYMNVSNEVYYDDRRTMKSYQTMQVQCFQERERNGNKCSSIYLHDILLDDDSLTADDLTALKTINKGNVKSLQISFWNEEVAAFILSLDLGVFTSLESLRVVRCDKEPEWLRNILIESAPKLNCLTLTGTLSGCNSLSENSIKTLKKLNGLQSLYLRDVSLTHSNLQDVYAIIGQTATLQQLKLERINCSDHRHMYPYRDCVIPLDLHRLKDLKMLDLDGPFGELHVNPAFLEKLKFRPWEKMTAVASTSLWEDLLRAPVLTSLELYKMVSCQAMIQAIPALTQIRDFKLERVDIVDGTPQFSSAMTQLRRVELPEVTMPYSAWKELLLSVVKVPQPVVVKLSRCEGPSNEEWKIIVKMIRSRPVLSLIQDLSVGMFGDASLTFKKLELSPKAIEYPANC